MNTVVSKAIANITLVGCAWAMISAGPDVNVRPPVPAVFGKIVECRDGVTPVKNAPVFLWDKLQQPKVENAKFSDSDGLYRFDNLTLKTIYLLRVDDKRYSTSETHELLLETDEVQQQDVICLSNFRSFAQPQLITFAKGITSIKRDTPGVSDLKRTAELLRKEPLGPFILVSGHRSVDEIANEDLERARSVRDYLNKLGIPETRIQIRGLRASCPDEFEQARRIVHEIVRKQRNVFDEVKFLGCGPAAQPRIFNPNEFVLTGIKEVSGRELAITLDYSYDGRRGTDDVELFVAALEGNFQIESTREKLQPGMRTVTVTLKRRSNARPVTSTELELLMLQDGKEFYKETHPYTKQWR